MKVGTTNVRLLTNPSLEDGKTTRSQASGEKGFGDMLKDAIGQVNKRLVEADELSTRLAMGEHLDIAQVMSEMAKADISFRLLLQVRNKALSAYEEIMRMQF